MTYKFNYKRWLFWKSIEACGHKFDTAIDRMDVYHKDGSITSIPHWSKHYLFLGLDWVSFTKKQMEMESGQDIKLKQG